MLNDALWFASRALEEVAVRPTYVSVFLLSQLQFLLFSVSASLRSTLSLFPSISVQTFGIQLYEIFRVLALKISWSLFSGGKHFPTIFKNSFPAFVFAFWWKGGLHQIMLRVLFRFSADGASLY